MTDYTRQDAMRDTGASRKTVSEMWHQAREDARACGELTDRPASTPSSRALNVPSFLDHPDMLRLNGGKWMIEPPTDTK